MGGDTRQASAVACGSGRVELLARVAAGAADRERPDGATGRRRRRVVPQRGGRDQWSIAEYPGRTARAADRWRLAMKHLILALLVAVRFITVHGPDDQEVTINVAEISSIRHSRGTADGFDSDVRCVLVMTNGKVHGVVEPCADVIRLI